MARQSEGEGVGEGEGEAMLWDARRESGEGAGPNEIRGSGLRDGPGSGWLRGSGCWDAVHVNDGWYFAWAITSACQ
jgi:hypothetical protein